MASPENIPLQVINAPTEQTPSDERKKVSNNDIRTNDSKPDVEKDKCHPSTIEDNEEDTDLIMGEVDNGDKWNNQLIGVSKDGHGDMPKIKSSVLPELLADNSGDVPKTSAPKSISGSVAFDHGKITKTTTSESIAEKSLASESTLLEDDNSDQTTASKSRSESEDPAKVPNTESPEFRSESISDEHNDAPKSTVHESNSEEVVEDGTRQTKTLENKELTDSMPFELELDLVLEDQVMSFVNLAISNATKSIRFQDDVEQDSNATITDVMKTETETEAERGIKSGNTYQDEKQSTEDDACQFKENETQKQSSGSQLEKKGNKVNPQNGIQLRNDETDKDTATVPDDLTIVDTQKYPTVVEIMDDEHDEDIQSKQEDGIQEEKGESLRINTEGLDGQVGLQESQSLPENSKLFQLDETIVTVIHHTASKNNESQTLFQNDKSDVQEEATRCLNANTMQNEPHLEAKNKVQQCLLYKIKSKQNERNDTKYVAENDKSDLQEDENVENKQNETSVMTDNTEYRHNLSKSNEGDSQKRDNTNIPDKLHITKFNNESENKYQDNKSCLQQKDNVENIRENLYGVKEDKTNVSPKEEVGIPVKKVNGVIDVRVSSDQGPDMKLKEYLSKTESKQDDQVGDSGLALVNDRLRVRIAELQSQIKEICCELAFVGDRNWRLEAYTECLIHTLEKMGVTDIEDLDQTTLSLELFKVKVKAGYRLGPYNGLPQRARRSYKRDGITPPMIDLSGGSLTCHTSKDSKSTKLPFSISETDDIGLSVRQMQQYESRIEAFTMKNHFLETQLQHLKNNNPNITVLPHQENPFPPGQPITQGTCQPVGMEHLGGIPPTVHSLPPPLLQPMVPQMDINHGNTSTESCRADSMTSTQQTTSPKPALSSSLPQTAADSPRFSSYVPPPRFRNKVGPHATTKPNTTRRNGSGSYRNDVWYGQGRRAPAWGRTERTNQSWRSPSQFN